MLPSEERYNISVTDLLVCPGKSAKKEWKRWAMPFNAKLIRGLQAENGIRRAGVVFDVLKPPDPDTGWFFAEDGIEAHPDELMDLTTNSGIDWKSSDFVDWRKDARDRDPWEYDVSEIHIDQTKSYGHLTDRERWFLPTTWNRANNSFGDLTTKELVFSRAELDDNWDTLLSRRPAVERARDWARSVAEPETIPAEFRRPNYNWECKNCEMRRGRLCPGR